MLSLDYKDKYDILDKKLNSLTTRHLKINRKKGIDARGFRVNAVDTVDDCINNIWVKRNTENNILIDTKHYKLFKRFERNGVPYEHSWKRLKRLYKQEEHLRKKYKELTLVKCDFLNKNIEVTPRVFLDLMRSMTYNTRNCIPMDNLLLGWNYSIELTEFLPNGDYIENYLWHMHLFVYFDGRFISRHENIKDREKAHYELITGFQTWLQGIYKSGNMKYDLLKDCRINVSRRFLDKEKKDMLLTTGDSILDRNRDRFWLSYNSKISESLSLYLKDNPHMKLFGTSQFG